MGKVCVRDISVTLTAPDGQNLVVVRVDTTEPGLFGLGCGTFAYRAFDVKNVIERSFKPLLLGRDVARIEDTWKLLMVNGYWRNGPIINNAVSGIDMALWDIKAKLAGMPLYDLLGGKCRERVQVYRHCNAGSKGEVLELAHQAVESGCKYLRVAYTAFDGPSQESSDLCLTGSGHVYDPKEHMKSILDLLTTLRETFGHSVELMTDTHERLDSVDVVVLAKKLEQLDLFFMEDPLPPEQTHWLHRIRASCTTPIAMGEVTHPLEWMPLLENRLIDYIPLPPERHRRPNAGEENRHHGGNLRHQDRLARTLRSDPHWPGGADPFGFGQPQFWHPGVLRLY
jgi:mannonate dehydratase